MEFGAESIELFAGIANDRLKDRKVLGVARFEDRVDFYFSEDGIPAKQMVLKLFSSSGQVEIVPIREMAPLYQMGSAFSNLPKTYESLVAKEAPRVIEGREHYDRVFKIVQIMAGHEMTKDQSDYLETLSQLVDVWEAENCEIGKDYEARLIKLLTLARDELKGNQVEGCWEDTIAKIEEVLSGGPTGEETP